MTCAGHLKAAEVRDTKGFLICRLARDVFAGGRAEIEDFTDWQIPVPAPSDRIHPAIMEFLRSEPEEMPKNDEAVTRVAGMLSEWEDGGELTTAFARRVVAAVRKIDRASDG